MLSGQLRVQPKSAARVRQSLFLPNCITTSTRVSPGLSKMASVNASTKANANLQNCKILSTEPLVRIRYQIRCMFMSLTIGQKGENAKWTKLVK